MYICIYLIKINYIIVRCLSVSQDIELPDDQNYCMVWKVCKDLVWVFGALVLSLYCKRIAVTLKYQGGSLSSLTFKISSLTVFTPQLSGG